MSEFNDLNNAFSEFTNLIPLFNGSTIREQAGVTDDEMLHIHAVACTFFEKGKLNESEKFFRHLCMLDSTNLDYLLGLGAVLQRKKLYPAAVDVYAAAHLVQENDSRPMFYAGQCHFFDRKHNKARYCFNIVIEDNHSEDLTKMAKLFIEAMEHSKTDD